MSSDNRIFQYKERMEEDMFLQLNKIIELLYIFLHTHSTTREAAHTCGHSLATIVYWHDMMREVSTQSIDNDQKMVSTAEKPVEIDRS